MKSLASLFSAALIVLSVARAEEQQLFNGKDLTGWEGQPGIWSVVDGALTGKTTAENPVKENTFLIWKGEASDFELTVKIKLLDANGEAKAAGNSGVQYLSKIIDHSYSVVVGYQADYELGKNYSGILYEEK